MLHKFPSTVLVAVFSLLCISACNSESGSAPQFSLPAVLPEAVEAAPADAIEFHWDRYTASCRNAAGQTGFNVDYVGECGRLVGKDLSGQDLSKKDLRGANLSESKIKGTRFDGADLRGANLLYTNWKEATFKGAMFSKESRLPFPPSQASVLGMTSLEYAALDASFVKAINESRAMRQDPIPANAQNLLSLGASLRLTGGQTSVYAAQARWLPFLQLLAQNGVKLADIRFNGGSLLQVHLASASYAFEKLDTEVSKFLLDQGVDPNAYDKKFSYSLALGYVLGPHPVASEIFKLLLAHKADPNFHPDRKESFLVRAISLLSFDTARLLIDAGVSLSVEGTDFGSIVDPLPDSQLAFAKELAGRGADLSHAWICQRRTVEFIDFLLKGGAQIDNTAGNGCAGATLLTTQFRNNSVDFKFVDFLIAKGANLDLAISSWIKTYDSIFTHYRDTFVDKVQNPSALLAYARIYGHRPSVEKLLARGADLNAKTEQWGNTVFGELLFSESKDWKIEELIAFISQGKVNPNVPFYNESLLAHALRMGGKYQSSGSWSYDKTKLVFDALLAAGADPNLRFERKGSGYAGLLTPLHMIGCMDPTRDILYFARKLVDRGGDASLADETGQVPLYNALVCGFGNPEFLQNNHKLASFFLEQTRDLPSDAKAPDSWLAFSLQSLCRYPQGKAELDSDRVAVVDELIRRGARIEPISLSLGAGEPEHFVEGLLRDNLVTPKGQSPLGCWNLLLNHYDSPVKQHASELSKQGGSVLVSTYGRWLEQGRDPQLADALGAVAKTLGDKYKLDYSKETYGVGKNPCPDCSTTLSYAYESGNKALVTFLRNKGAQERVIPVPTSSGNNPNPNCDYFNRDRGFSLRYGGCLSPLGYVWNNAQAIEIGFRSNHPVDYCALGDRYRSWRTPRAEAIVREYWAGNLRSSDVYYLVGSSVRLNDDIEIQPVLDGKTGKLENRIFTKDTGQFPVVLLCHL